MIDFDEAQKLLAEAVKPLAIERVALAEAFDRVLAEPVHAAISAPRRAVSAMDGYALRDSDAAIGATLRIAGESFAGGLLPPAIGPGQCLRIFTGAALPEGADRVIMQENCRAENGSMTIVAAYGPGWHVRPEASDFAQGDLLLQQGTLLTPRAMVTLAGADVDTALVYKRPRVAIIATGDELAPPGTARNNVLKIPESVSFGAAALAREYGASIEARFTGADELADLRRLADRALTLANVVVVTGGASVGERDFAKAMFDDQNLEMLFTKVAMKPGKPIWIGRAQGRWVVGLPGNPTSAMVTARLFLAPLLALLQGRAIGDAVNWLHLPITGQWPQRQTRTNFVRACMTDEGLVPTQNQDSGAQLPLQESDWLVRIDPEHDDASPEFFKFTAKALQF